ncbi:MAG: hypothetical protein EXR70_14995 [Deltaproteobacteria bacterium]|nr:hypothetical protein [Deltaproteobacteria bacterium]
MNRETHMDSPNKIKWTAIIKNAGKVPGVVLREQFKAYITDGNDRETTKLIQQDVNGAKYLLPDNTFKYTGQFVTVDGIASVKDVINDKTRLYIEIKLYYSLPGYSDPQYFYEAKLRATPNIGVEQGFMFVSAIENSLSSH